MTSSMTAVGQILSWRIQVAIPSFQAEVLTSRTAPGATSHPSSKRFRRENVVLLGAEASVSGTFSDPDLDDTHTATWSWGDGTSSEGAINGIVTGSHIYQQTGVYTVTLSVSDGTAVGTLAYEYIVTYDPAGGFVTGGGWIDSPSGAYASDSGLTGKAHSD